MTRKLSAVSFLCVRAPLAQIRQLKAVYSGSPFDMLRQGMVLLNAS
jgi:hypothetical protein